MRREQKPLAGVRPASKPAHTSTLIGYTTQRDAIPAGCKPELIERYREVAAAFPTVDLPPLETAYWLVKPRSLVRGTWDEAKEAALWASACVAVYAPRIASERERDFVDLAVLVNSVVERLGSESDVSLGLYLERPLYLSLAVVARSPNRSKPELPCPVLGRDVGSGGDAVH